MGKPKTKISIRLLVIFFIIAGFVAWNLYKGKDFSAIAYHIDIGITAGLITMFYNKKYIVKPDYANAYNNMGLAYENKGNYEKTITYYEKAIELKPDFEFAYTNMGIAYQHLGEQEKANDCFQKASMIRHNVSFTEYK